MLEKITEKLWSYKIIVTPTKICTYIEGDEVEPYQTSGIVDRFMTRRGFEKRIAKLRESQRTNDPNLFGLGVAHYTDWFILDSIKVDDHTFIMIPDTIPQVQGEYSIEIPEEFREFFPKYFPNKKGE